MYALYDEQRQQLMRLSAMLVCGGLAILPFTLPPASIAANAQAAPNYARIGVPSVPARLEFPEIAVRKDPFVPDVGIEPVGSSTNGTQQVHQGDDIGIVLPANVGAQDEAPAALPGAFALRGLVLGDEPQALIDIGSGVKVYAIGDRIGSDSIAKIDADGVTLSSGIRLKIVSKNP